MFRVQLFYHDTDPDGDDAQESVRGSATVRSRKISSGDVLAKGVFRDLSHSILVQQVRNLFGGIGGFM